LKATTTLQLGSPSDCQPSCHRNGSSKRNLGHLQLFLGITRHQLS